MQSLAMLAHNDRAEVRVRSYADDLLWAVLRHMHGGENGVMMPSEYAMGGLYVKQKAPKEETTQDVISGLIDQLGG